MTSCSMINNGIAQQLEPSAMDDGLLVEAAQAGQEWAFVELCTRNSKRVFNVIYGVTKNREDAEDALQDSMMRAFLHLKQFDGRASFATWFTRIGMNSALMILRRKRIRPETSIDVTAEGETWRTWQIADCSADPEKHYAGYEASLHLKKAICRLPNVLRSVVERQQMEGHSMKQIAHNMGISIPATKSRLARAKVALRKSMLATPRSATMSWQQQAEIAQLQERYARLTAREREVLRLVVSGMLTKQIASTLAMSEMTATVHRGHVMRKMQANSPAELGEIAEKLKLPTRT